MKIHKGDKVIVIAGKDKGKTASVLQVITKSQKVLLEGVNIIKKHVKPGKITKEGGILKMEKPVHVSNVMFLEGSKKVRLKKIRPVKKSETKKVEKTK